MDCRHSFRASRALPSAGLLCLVTALLVSTGCSTVRPQDKELLADPGMSYAGGGEADIQEEHVLSNREGAAGAGKSSGGGCGCN